MTLDTTQVMRFVDDFMDRDPGSKNHCPGSIFKEELFPKCYQYNRRFRFFKRVKNIVYQLGNTNQYWYKSSKCNVAAAAMGFSQKHLKNHPKAVSMETYARIFQAEPDDYISEMGMTAGEWMKLNDFEFI